MWLKREGAWLGQVGPISECATYLAALNCMECPDPRVPSGMPALAPLVRTTPRLYTGLGYRRPARMPACPVARSPGRPFTRLPACPPAHSPPTVRTEGVITERTAVLARADTRVPHTTCPRHSPTLCVSTRISTCTCSSACLPSLSMPARPPRNGSLNPEIKNKIKKSTLLVQNRKSGKMEKNVLSNFEVGKKYDPDSKNILPHTVLCCLWRRRGRLIS